MNAQIGPYTFEHDGQTNVFVASCELRIGEIRHQIITQGMTMAEARAALDSASELTLKHWPSGAQSVLTNKAAESAQRARDLDAILAVPTALIVGLILREKVHVAEDEDDARGRAEAAAQNIAALYRTAIDPRWA